MQRIAVIGLGAMGAPMAATLAGAGFDVTGHDTHPARREALPGAVETLGALADREAVILSLPNDAIVRAVVGDLLGILPEGALIIDTSTVAAATAQALAAEAQAAGRRYLDVPVSGGAAGAASGTLLMMAGGAAEDIARARPVFDALARKLVHCGGPGAGATAKLANNLLCAGQLMLAGEALRLAEGGGVTASALLEAVNAGSGRSAVTEVNLPRWVLSENFDSGFTLGLMAKDVGLAAGAPGAGRLASTIATHWAEAADRLGADSDFNRIVTVTP
jgi:3-hydroxyisobutyrate dehydrogenase